MEAQRMTAMVETVEVKTCSHCKAIKNRSEFYRSSASRDGLNSKCKTCSNETTRKWALKNKEKVIEYLRNHRKRCYPDVDIIYAIWSAVHNKVVYIGSTTVTLPERIAKHKYEAFVEERKHGLYEAMREYGWDNFTFFVINDEDSEKFNEDYYIEVMKPLFNRMSGIKTRRYRNVKAN